MSLAIRIFAGAAALAFCACNAIAGINEPKDDTGSSGTSGTSGTSGASSKFDGTWKTIPDAPGTVDERNCGVGAVTQFTKKYTFVVTTQSTSPLLVTSRVVELGNCPVRLAGPEGASTLGLAELGQACSSDGATTVYENVRFTTTDGANGTLETSGTIAGCPYTGIFTLVKSVPDTGTP